MDSFDFNQFANSLQKAQSYAVSYKHRNGDEHIQSCCPQNHGVVNPEGHEKTEWVG